MNFYHKLLQADRGLSRLYKKRKLWLWIVVITPVAAVVAWGFWVAIWGAPAAGVSLVIHSELDRPILGFSVNGVAGGNASAHGGGATTCCGYLSGKTAEVIWTLSMTGPQYEAGMRLEKHRVILPLPERKRGENDLHVHFLSEDKVLLGWSDNAWSPYDKNNPKHTQHLYKK